MVLSYIAKLIKRANLQKKAHFFDSKNSIFIISFWASFRLFCNASKIHESAAKWVPPHYGPEALANVLYSRKCAEGRPAPFPTSERNDQDRSRKLLRSYPEEVNYFIKKYVTVQAIAGYETKILRYLQPANKTFQRNAEDFIAKLCKVTDVYDEDTLNDLLIKGLDRSIRHRLQNYCAANPQAEVFDIGVQVKLLLAIRNGSEQQPIVNRPQSS